MQGDMRIEIFVFQSCFPNGCAHSELTVLWLRHHQKRGFAEASPAAQTLRNCAKPYLLRNLRHLCHVFLGANSTCPSWDQRKLNMLRLHTCAYIKGEFDYKLITLRYKYLYPPQSLLSSPAPQGLHSGDLPLGRDTSQG